MVGHLFVDSHSLEAIEKVDGMQIGEKTVGVGVGHFVKRSERSWGANGETDAGDKPTMNTFTNVYIKNFPTDWDEEKVKTEFGKCGKVQMICWSTFLNSTEGPVSLTVSLALQITSAFLSADNKGRKFAFLNFETHEEAKKAIDEMHQKDFRTEEQKEADKDCPDGEKEEEEKDNAEKSYLLYVNRAQSKTERALELKEKMPAREPAGRSQGVNLYIKNLDEQTDDDSLRGLFESFGNITSVCAMKEPSGKCKGFGFVCFSSPDEATKAVTEMHLKVVKGKPLYVGLAENRDVRAERLRQRYSPAGVGKGKGKGKGGMGMYGNPMGGMGGVSNAEKAGVFEAQQALDSWFSMALEGEGPMGAMGPMGPMGMMRPPMMPMMRPGGDGRSEVACLVWDMRSLPHFGMPSQGPAQAPPANTGQQLTAAALAAAPPPATGQFGGKKGPWGPVQKQMIGERLFPAISKHQPELAGKITGMMLEMDNSELLILLDSEHQLKAKVDEAMRVLEQAKYLCQNNVLLRPMREMRCADARSALRGSLERMFFRWPKKAKTHQRKAVQTLTCNCR
ncbi:Polyadenylate-binding protein [Durusdinium trenchii]|uniref:Cytoplasmic and nuclear (PABP) (Poly(A)-binding protein) (Polyadenylate tail-binding protein) n=1 Tax=Durusdinium trenchii TaxID=1381693 RepID=A0ABP0MUE8_9DINO